MGGTNTNGKLIVSSLTSLTAIASPPPTLEARATLMTISMMTVMAGAIVAPALPQIETAFAAFPDSDLLAKLVLAIPALAIALFAPLSGVLVDRFGRRRLLLIGLGLYTLAGTTGLYLSDPYPILAGRLGLGVAIALMMTTSTTLISDYFAGLERARFLGLQASFMGLGGVLFLPLGGQLATLNWHAPFAVYVAALPLLYAAWSYLPEPPRITTDPIPGQSIDEPMPIPWPTVLMLYFVGLSAMVAFYLGPVQVPFHMKSLYGAEPTKSSFAIAAITLAGVVTSLFYGRIAKRIAAPWILVILYALVGCGHVIIGTANIEFMTWLGLMISGFGSGLMIPTLSTWMMRISPNRFRGRLTGGMMSAIFVGQFLSPILVRPLVINGGTSRAFEVIGYVMLALCAIFFVGAMRVRRSARPV